MDSISEAGDFIYDSVNFWDDETDEPEQSEAIIIEEAVEVPDYAIPDENFLTPEISQQNIPMPLAQPQPYYDPVYRIARQYYFVGPNGTPLLAPPPPPFPQYSIDQANPVVPYSYYNSLNNIQQPQLPNQSTQVLEQPAKKCYQNVIERRRDGTLQSKTTVLELKKILLMEAMFVMILNRYYLILAFFSFQPPVKQ